MDPTLTLIAALDLNRAIGRSNVLPWQLPNDLKRFKAFTLGKPVLMGRKTAQSLGRALPGRKNLVLTRQGAVPFDGMTACSSIEAALSAAAPCEEIMVIGGGDIYALALPWADRMLLTHVETEVEGADAFFPAFDEREWLVQHHECHRPDERHAAGFSFVDYVRV